MADKSTALIVDDEPDIRELLEITLGRMGLETYSAENISQAKTLLKEHPINLCLTDMQLPDGNGLDLVAFIQQEYSHIPVAVITAFGSMDTAISALKAGAFDFVSKPVDLPRLRDLISTALKLTNDSAKKTNQPTATKLLGSAPTIVSLHKRIIKLARSQAPVYIHGESGTGKELVAKLIHEQGPRADNPFIPVNCGAIPKELMESEFFGHKKGSFTGATTDKPGLFQAAHGGTLFLDEVADLPLEMQVKLLRAIQEKAIRSVGSHQETSTDIRVLSATHKNLADLVESGDFRQDLYYRLNVIELQVPPLRERKEDIAELTAFSLQKLSAQWGDTPPVLTDSAKDALQNYLFPGNVRELENILERAYTLCEDDIIDTPDLQLPNNAPTESVEQSAPVMSGGSLEDFLETIEKQAINNALEETRWNKTAAAKKLGITFRALRYRLKKLDME
jgi:two-component system response regulator PilR (NtrC family)